jgi:hypothetical protein
LCANKLRQRCHRLTASIKYSKILGSLFDKSPLHGGTRLNPQRFGFFFEAKGDDETFRGASAAPDLNFLLEQEQKVESGFAHAALEHRTFK